MDRLSAFDELDVVCFSTKAKYCMNISLRLLDVESFELCGLDGENNLVKRVPIPVAMLRCVGAASQM